MLDEAVITYIATDTAHAIVQGTDAAQDVVVARDEEA